MANLVEQSVEDYAIDHTTDPPAPLEELHRETHETMQSPQMLTGILEGRLLKLLIQMIGARRVLEIGTFTGYAALSMAEGLPEDGRLITCEINPKHAAFARKYFERSPHGRKIELMEGPALETLTELKPSFDFAFIDADKENYLRYYEVVIELLRSGGFVAIDNALWSGSVLEPGDIESKTIDALNKRLAGDTRVETVLLTVRDGIQLARKR